MRQNRSSTSSATSHHLQLLDGLANPRMLRVGTTIYRRVPVLAHRPACGLASRPLHELLSDREYEVMRMIAAGAPLTEIGERLHVSVKTVSTYRARIMEKMQLKTNADLTRYALTQALID